MSTNYYLINKQDEKIKERLDILIEKNMEKIKESLIAFSDDEGLGIEDDIKDKIRSIKTSLEYELFQVDDIHICNTGYKSMTWISNNCFKDKISFATFFEQHKDIYALKDEYGKELSIDEFLEKIKELNID